MHKFYYLTGAMILVLGGLGIYSSQAGNKMMKEPSDVIAVEEAVYIATPSQPNSPNSTPNTNGGFIPLPQDKGVEVEPAPQNPAQNQNQTPNLEQNPATEEYIQESVSESMD